MLDIISQVSWAIVYFIILTWFEKLIFTKTVCYHWCKQKIKKLLNVENREEEVIKDKMKAKKAAKNSPD